MLKNYCDHFTAKTSKNDSWEHLFFGLVAEVGEFSSIYQRHYRGDKKADLSLPEIKNKLLLESGDILWYLCRINEVFGSHTIFDVNLKVPPLFCGDFLPQIVADIKNAYNLGLKNKISYWCGIGVQTISRLAEYHGSSLTDLIELNVRKLENRLIKGTIAGQGNNR